MCHHLDFFKKSRQNAGKILGVGLLISVSSLLTGCGDLNSQFTCPMKPGVTCQSLDQVNTLVDQGKIAQAKPAESAGSTLTVNISYLADQPERDPETVMRLWVAPYQDSQGNYFSAGTVYHVIQPSHWVNTSAASHKSADASIKPMSDATHA